MRTLYIIFLFSILGSHITAQSCGNTNITLTSQDDVDNFQSTYGVCDSLHAILRIGNGNATDIDDLMPLSNLTYVFQLLITNNDALQSLEGLENLDIHSISKLTVTGNLLLSDISQLSGLGPSGGDVGIVDNPELATLDGLQNLKNFGTSFSVRDMPKLTSLSPMCGITGVARVFAFVNNNALTDISALSDLESFGGAPNDIFQLKENDALEDCSPLCYFFQEIFPLNNTELVEIQNNLNTCIDLPAILSDCTDQSGGIYSGNGAVEAHTSVVLDSAITFDTSTFIIDGITNRVGIGTDTPQATLDVDGTVKLSSLPTSGTVSKIIAIDVNGNAFEYDISNYDSDASDDFDKAFTSLTGIPAGLSDGDDNTQLTDAQITALGYIKSTNDADSDPTNEIQDLSPYQTIAGAASWDQNASDDFDGAFSSLTAIPAGLADGDDNTQLSDSDISTLGYIKSANDADSDPTNELYDDSDVIDSIAALRSDITALESQGPGSSLYNSDGSITGNRVITLGTSDINFDANTFVIDGSDNKIGIGTNTPTYELDVIGDVGISGAIYGLSDERLKKDKAPITDALSILSKLNPVTYNFNQEKYGHLNLSEDKQYGLIAQELEKVLPELVSSMQHTKEGEELKSVNYDGLIALLIAAIQEQAELIKSQSAVVEKLLVDLNKK